MELPVRIPLLVLVFELAVERVKVAEALAVLERQDAEPVGEAVAVFDMVELLVNTVCVPITVPVY